jgi:CheY-like chemotaxis protein
MNILLADDDKVSRELLRRLLESEPGCVVTTAADGEEAWCLLRDASRRFDVGFFDIIMPRLDGIELLERVRTTPGLRALPVVLCTAANDHPMVENACLLSVSHYIIKPYGKSVVLEKLHLVQAELAGGPATEDAQTVADRLGLDPAVLNGLVSALLPDIESWLAVARRVRHPVEFQRLAVSANGLKGGCLNLGLCGLAHRLDTLEAIFAHEFNGQHRFASELTVDEVATSLRPLAQELARVQNGRHQTAA